MSVRRIILRGSIAETFVSHQAMLITIPITHAIAVAAATFPASRTAVAGNTK
ncbi:hypothetical protein GCM10009777_36980 [Microbacterium pumilum]|uniref:Uncharacterized protein n=2 Tax=Microbacterium pumilum TaxID=344165 RepID=A0ABP5EHG8_9MICO